MGLNRELLRRVAQSIRSEEHMKYRQGSFFRKLYKLEQGVAIKQCGTIGCVAGHAILEAHGMDKLREIDRHDYSGVSFQRTAGDALGLDDFQRECLFSGCPMPEYLADAFTLDLSQIPIACDFPNDHMRFGANAMPFPDVSPQWMAAVLEAIAEKAS